MAVIAFVSEFDCGGRNEVWCRIINNLTQHLAFNVVYRKTTLDYGEPLIARTHNGALQDVLDKTDIIVACPGMDHGRTGPGICSDPESLACVYDGPYLPLNGQTWAHLDKPIVIYLWGSLNLRTHYKEFHQAFDKFKAVWCADCDVAADGDFKMAPMPNFYPWLEAHAIWPDSWPLRVVQTVTDRAIKNTDELEAIIKPRCPDIILDLIENEPLCDSLIRKSKAHVNFDHLQGYFGNASFEATWMGLPNVVGVTRPDYQNAIKDGWQSDTIPPWHIIKSMGELEPLLDRFLLEDGFWEGSAYAHFDWHEKHADWPQIIERLFVEPCQ